MKKTLAVITLLSVLAIPASSVFARGGGCGSCVNSGNKISQPFRHLDRMQYILGLTDAQVDKIYNIHKEYRDKIYKNRKNSDKVQSLRDEQRNAVEKVLTKEQKMKWDEFKKNHFRKGSGKGQGKGYNR